MNHTNPIKEILGFAARMSGTSYEKICMEIQLLSSSANQSDAGTIKKAINVFFDLNKIDQKKELLPNEELILSYITKFIISYNKTSEAYYLNLSRYIKDLDVLLEKRGISSAEYKSISDIKRTDIDKLFSEVLKNNLSDSLNLDSNENPVSQKLKFEILIFL